jgi:opacity protein-like surface antigen
MKKNLLILGMMVCSLTMLGQAKKDGTTSSVDRGWYLKLGGSYFTQATATEFPSVNGREPNKDVFVQGALTSRESITGSFGEGFRTGLTGGYRFNSRVGVEMGVNYYASNEKTMVQTISDNTKVLEIEGQVKALDLAPALVLFLGESNGFEPYTKVGVIVPVNGQLDIKTNAVTAGGPLYRKDVIKPQPTVGFLASLGTTYKLTEKLSAFAEIEYRNFTVNGKSKEVTEYTIGGANAFQIPAGAPGHLSEAEININYRSSLNSTSNNSTTNPSGYDETKPGDDLSSYISISGVGLTLGLKYKL